MTWPTQELEDSIKIALQLYTENPKLKIAKLAREFKDPYQLLPGRIKGAKPLKGHNGHGKSLELEQEQTLIHWIHTLNHANAPPTAEMIQQAALQIIRRHDPRRTLGPNWAYRFIKRLPDDCLVITHNPIEKDRIEAVTPGHLNPKG